MLHPEQLIDQLQGMRLDDTPAIQSSDGDRLKRAKKNKKKVKKGKKTADRIKVSARRLPGSLTRKQRVLLACRKEPEPERKKAQEGAWLCKPTWLCKPKTRHEKAVEKAEKEVHRLEHQLAKKKEELERSSGDFSDDDKLQPGKKTLLGLLAKEEEEDYSDDEKYYC